MMLDGKRLIATVYLIAAVGLCPGLSITAADAAAGPGWINAQGKPVTPDEAYAHYKTATPLRTLETATATAQGATAATPEITALARALKNDPKLIYEYVRNHVDYVPYFGSLKGATLTYLDGSGNDFDQASLMITLLRESGYTANYVYGTMLIPTLDASTLKDMVHWLGVDADSGIISTVLANGAIPAYENGSYWQVNRVWVEALISGSTYVFDPAFKPYEVTQGIDLKTAMGYDRSTLLSAAGGTIGTDYVQNLSETGLRDILDGYTMNLVTDLRANHPNAKTSEIIGGRKIIPQHLEELPTSLEFSTPTQQDPWTDIPGEFTHKVRIKHGEIDQTLNIPDLAGQKLSITYRSAQESMAASLMEAASQSEPVPNLAEPRITPAEIDPITIPAASASFTPQEIKVSAMSAEKDADASISPMASAGGADFGKVSPSGGYSEITWTFNNINAVTKQLVATLQNNGSGAYSFTSGGGTNNVGAHQNHSVTVRFSGSGQSPGTKTAQLRIQWCHVGGGCYSDFYYDLSGVVANPLILGGYGMNLQAYMNEPYVGTCRLQNNGTLSLTVNGTSRAGAGANRFEIVSGGGAFTLPPGGYRDIQVRFKADVHGIHNAYLRFDMTYDGLAYSYDALPLQGQAAYKPDLTGSYGFNTMAYLSDPEEGVLRLKNSGNQVLNITGVSITGTDPSHFQIIAGNQTGDVPSGQYRDIGVRYLADTLGTHSATARISFTYDGLSQWIDLPLSGQSVAAPVAQLWLDDQLLVEESDPVTGTNLKNLIISINHPYLDEDFADQEVNYTLRRGSTYAIIYDFGGSRQGRLLEKRERQMQTYRESGHVDTSREVLTESLNVIGMTWMRDTTLNDNLLAEIAGVIDLRHHRFGVVAQESGYYIDVKAQMIANTSRNGDETSSKAYFKAINHLASAMEHGVLEQMQVDRPSVSTVKLLQLTNAAGGKIFRADSSNYSTAIRPQLSGYASTDLDEFQTKVNGGSTLFLPANGQISLQDWSGKGYIEYKVDVVNSSSEVGMIIGGDYHGGYGALELPINIPNMSYYLSLNIQPQATTSKIGSSDPVDMATGHWMFDNTDLSLSGGTGGLALKRSYNSGNNNLKNSMGYGWSHNYDLFVEPHSSSPFGLGERQPLDAAALIVASVATLDVLSGTPDLKSWMTTALLGKWGMDRLTNNAASVHLETDVLTFVKLPDGSYASPPGVTSKLVLANGLFQVNERFGRTIKFNADNRVSLITDADGNPVNFTYDVGKLESVADNFGHSLTFHYTGDRLESVSDSAGRSVAYGYDENNDLRSFKDPEEKSWSYDYDGKHRVETVRNPRDITTVTNFYDSLGRVERQTVPRQTGTVTYNLYFSGYRNIEEDAAGRQTIYHFDDAKHLLAVEDALGRKTVMTYDGQNHVVTRTDPRLYTTTYFYDGDNNLVSIIDPYEKETVNTYDPQFRLTEVKDPLQHLTHYDYDDEHHLTKTTRYPKPGKNIETGRDYYPNGLLKTTADGRQIVTTLVPDAHGNPDTSKTDLAPAIDYTYDSIGRMTDLTDQEGAKTSFIYDKRSLLKSKTDPLLKSVTLDYYDDGTLWKITDRNNKTTTYTPTPTGKTDTVTYHGGSTVSYIYNEVDNLTEMHDSIGGTTYRYDEVNRLRSQTNPHNFTVSYEPDENGNVTKITYPGDKTVSYTYDRLNRVETVKIDWLNKTATYHYDDAGRLTDLTQFNGSTAHYTLDDADRMTGLENRTSAGGSVISAYTYILDGNGNRTDVTQTTPIGMNLSPSNRTFTMNPKKNRLQQAGTTSFTYDDEGQLATTAEDAFGFDDAHRLTSISGSVNYQYRYDGSGNRLQATRNGAVTRYVYDANGSLLAEADGNNVIQRYYIHGNGLLAMVTEGGALYCYHFDGTGHTVSLTDASKNVVNKYAYTPFGTIGNKNEAISQPFTYVGKYGVMTEPNGLYYMRARYYDPSVGRFISEDPKGFDGGDVNLMAYVKNDPVNGVDPAGLWTLSVGVYGNAALGGGGGGGTAINIGYSKQDGFSFSLTGTAQGGAIAGGGAFIGGGISYTNAKNVNQLNGTSYQVGRAGLGPVAVEGIKGSDYIGGSLFGGAGIGYTANSVTASTTSAMYQYSNGVHSIGNTGNISLWNSGK